MRTNPFCSSHRRAPVLFVIHGRKVYILARIDFVMGWKERYEKAKETILHDAKICAANRDLFRRFFEFEEYKLKRKNGLASLDVGCYKTLYGYTLRLRNVNTWFKNKPWKKLTRTDIKRVYDDLEDGKITNQKGIRIGDRSSYYFKIFKSKPFRLAGKSELAKDVIEFHTHVDREVRFVTEDTFRKMTSVVLNPSHLLLLWLAWDIGENVDALLKLQKKDFTRQRNKHTREPEFLINFSKAKIKRSRKARTEPTLYPETPRFSDIVLSGLKPDDNVFGFGYRQALKVMHSIVHKTKATCMPNNDPVSWKDLRSGMACHLLKIGWTREEVDARLGHTPQSSALNAYINYLAIDREKPKRRVFDTSLEEVKSELDEAKRRERLTGERVMRQAEENQLLRSEVEDLRQLVQRAIKKTVA